MFFRGQGETKKRRRKAAPAPATLKDSIQVLLRETWPKGMHVEKMIEEMTERGWKDWTKVMVPETVVSAICSHNFSRIGHLTYALHSSPDHSGAGSESDVPLQTRLDAMART